jgi:hypothetical protein
VACTSAENMSAPHYTAERCKFPIAQRIAWGKLHFRLKNKLQAESMSFGSIVVAVAVKDGGRLDKNNKS